MTARMCWTDLAGVDIFLPSFFFKSRFLWNRSLGRWIVKLYEHWLKVILRNYVSSLKLVETSIKNP